MMKNVSFTGGLETWRLQSDGISVVRESSLITKARLKNVGYYLDLNTYEPKVMKH